MNWDGGGGWTNTRWEPEKRRVEREDVKKKGGLVGGAVG